MQATDGAPRVEIARVPFEAFKRPIATAGLIAAGTAIHNIRLRASSPSN